MVNLSIVLIEPQIPQNTGNVARTCAALGAPLHLVRPMGFEVDDKKLKRAGLDYWHLLDITYHASTEAFLSAAGGPYVFFSSKVSTLYTEQSYPPGVFLVFGREDAGLPDQLLQRFPHSHARLPMISAARCLNLASTVSAAAYEAARQQGFEGLQTSGLF